MFVRRQKHRSCIRIRRGAGSVDYILTIGALFFMSSIVVLYGRRIMQLVYEMTGLMIGWPFM